MCIHTGEAIAWPHEIGAVFGIAAQPRFHLADDEIANLGEPLGRELETYLVVGNTVHPLDVVLETRIFIEHRAHVELRVVGHRSPAAIPEFARDHAGCSARRVGKTMVPYVTGGRDWIGIECS